MPAIIKEDKQVQALEAITTELETLTLYNNAIEAKTPALSVCVKPEGSKKTINLAAEDKMYEKIMDAIRAEHKRLYKSIRQKAEKFRISFDDTDNVILSKAEILFGNFTDDGAEVSNISPVAEEDRDIPGTDEKESAEDFNFFTF